MQGLLAGLAGYEDFEDAEVYEAGEFALEEALAVDEVGGGHYSDEVGVGDCAVEVEAEGVGDADVLGEGPGVGFEVVGGEADEDYAVVAVGEPGVLEGGHFASAGWAPGGPEVEDDDVAA